MTIFKTENLSCSLGPSEIIDKKDNSFSVNHNKSGSFELHVRGRGRVIWPNREGEGFEISSVFPALKANGCLESGLALSWPATASAEAVMVKTIQEKSESAADGFIFHTESLTEGLHREIRIFADGLDSVRIRFSGIPGRWKADILSDFKSKSARAVLPAHKLRYQFQAGLIGPDGRSEAAEYSPEAGFAVLPVLAERLRNNFEPLSELSGELNSMHGNSPLIHIFGYAEGHDCGYPDYTPATRLGGKRGLSMAAEGLHKQGFMLSCYLNARIAEEYTLRRYPLLQTGICRGDDASPVIEIYNNRRFNVMEPSNEAWLEHLYDQAMMLQECGADAVQLDQVSGRAPVVPPGAPWGAGYSHLIKRLHDAGLQVWIQGVSDYYPADWFEMTHRDLSILPGGILRGGNPFGQTDLGLLKTVNRQAAYLVPLEKAQALKHDYGSLSAVGLPLIIDVMNSGEELPLFGDAYLSMLSRIEAEWNSQRL